MKVLALVVMLSLCFGSAVIAQDVTPTVVPPGDQPMAQGTTVGIGDITGDSASYYGQTVTVTGNVDELVNIRSFVLGEGGVGNPQLLVLNNSGQEFNLGLTKDADVSVTGVIYPSASEGGWDQLMNDLSSGMVGQQANADTATATPSGDMGQGAQMTGAIGLDQYPTSLFTDRFPEHTLLIVNSVDDITFTDTQG